MPLGTTRLHYIINKTDAEVHFCNNEHQEEDVRKIQSHKKLELNKDFTLANNDAELQQRFMRISSHFWQVVHVAKWIGSLEK